VSARGLLRAALFIFLGIAIAGAAWAGWQVWQVNKELSAAVSDASTLESAVQSGDDSGARKALADLSAHTDSAADRTRGLTWSVLARTPWFGDDAAGVRLVSDVINDLARDGIAPLVDDATDLEAMLPRNGRVPLETLASLQLPVEDASTAFSEADRRLSAQDPASFVGQLESRYRDLHRRVSESAAVLSSANAVLHLMPAMLGRESPRTYLLVFQNNAEARATGGLPGALGVLTAKSGRLKLTRQVSATTFKMLEEPVLPLSEAERQIYGDQLGTYIQDANFTPDFPRTAELMKARWELAYGDEIDGVFAIDPVALSYILSVTGPVEVDGIGLNGENVVDELLNRTYLRLDDPGAQDEFFRHAARAVFEKVTTGVSNPRALYSALRRANDEHRLYLHSFYTEEQAELSGRTIAGELAMDESSGPQVGVYLNDATGSKMSFYLRAAVRLDSVGCRNGEQSLTGTARLRSEAPPDAATALPDSVTGGGLYGTPAGSQLVAVRLYAPVEGAIDRIMLNGKSLADASIVRQGSRDVASVFVSLKPQQTLDLTWQMTTGPEQTGDVVVTVTPGIEARESSSVAASSC
jgi:hypothetical protein